MTTFVGCTGATLSLNQNSQPRIKINSSTVVSIWGWSGSESEILI
jgi:hypothetical protein